MLKVFTVYDEKAEAYLDPKFCNSVGEMVRAFAHAASSEGHDFNRFASDFTLFFIGEWDPRTGEFTPSPTKQSLGTALEHKGVNGRDIE